MVQRIAAETWGPAGVTKRPRFNRWFLAWSGSGLGELADDQGQRFELAAGSLWLMRPGSSYEVRIRRPMDLHVLTADGPRAATLLRRWLGDQQLHWPQTDDVSASFAAILQAAQAGGPHVDAICDHLLEVLLLQIHTALLRGASPPDRHWQRLLGLRISPTPMPLPSPASLPGPPRWDSTVPIWSRVIRAATGQTAKTYLEDRKLQLAADHLLMTDKSIAHIATLVGYNDASTFCRSFKRRYGSTPRRFRGQ